MTVIVKPDRRAPTAVNMLWVRVGSMDEVDGTSGVAHVLEHMMFKGTRELKPGEFSRRVAALGGRENAFTSKDNTGYFQQIPSGRLEDVMKLEADRFANNQWDDDEFRRELEVVKEERRMRTDDSPRAQLYEAMGAAIYQAAPYRRPIVGWMSDLDAMTPADARAFFERWYVPRPWWWPVMWTRRRSCAWRRNTTAASPRVPCPRASRVKSLSRPAFAASTTRRQPSRRTSRWLSRCRR